MLLRKTRANSINVFLPKFLKLFPDPQSLSKADVTLLSDTLRPLGIHRERAGALVRVGQALVEKHEGEVPKDYSALVALPHVGRYTANAVLCFAFGEDRAVVDNNVARLYCRLYSLPRPREIHKADSLWQLAQEHIVLNKAQEFNWALLDLSGTICLSRQPKCHICPLSELCNYATIGVTRASNEQRREVTAMLRKYRSGVLFDCEVCGKLLRECVEHNPPDLRACPICKGDLKKVGAGIAAHVGDAIWFRCLTCDRLFMRRRGETIETKPRAGFDEFT